MNVEHQIKALLASGLRLHDEVTVATIARRHEDRWNRVHPARTERGEWARVLGTLGYTLPDAVTDDVLDFDLECDANYPKLIAELERLSGFGPVTILEWVQDDWEDWDAPHHVTIDVGGGPVTWNFDGNGDWCSPECFDKFDALLEGRPRRLFEVTQEQATADIWGDCTPVLCCTEAVRQSIETLTGIPFHPACG